MNSNITQAVINKVIDVIDKECAPSRMTKEEYLETLEGIQDRVECMIDCVKDELDE